jgi:hypothetical protein
MSASISDGERSDLAYSVGARAIDPKAASCPSQIPCSERASAFRLALGREVVGLVPFIWQRSHIS